MVECGSGVQRLQVEAVLCIGYSGLPHSMSASGQSGCLQDSLGLQACLAFFTYPQKSHSITASVDTSLCSREWDRQLILTGGGSSKKQWVWDNHCYSLRSVSTSAAAAESLG